MQNATETIVTHGPALFVGGYDRPHKMVACQEEARSKSPLTPECRFDKRARVLYRSGLGHIQAKLSDKADAQPSADSRMASPKSAEPVSQCSLRREDESGIELLELKYSPP